MKHDFFDHLLTLARLACPGHTHKGVDLGSIIIEGYRRELIQDLKGLPFLRTKQPTLEMCLLIEEYTRNYEGYLFYWLLLQSMQNKTNSSLPGERSQAETWREKIKDTFGQWRNWRHISLYQLKKYWLSQPADVAANDTQVLLSDINFHKMNNKRVL
ncbi:hypothetical protein [Chitinophaga sp. S165]|uniref:hypothetical protein n=1 Tax=Chitinophaga sp. S165 TaxID=2135462 RepID=UPI000D70EE66|nr:hypothetical protein [Chitinophaga sp. S165]PWV47145.1 hypothetical protein C7475_109233 [Chitinophaga sp. S165]